MMDALVHDKIGVHANLKTALLDIQSLNEAALAHRYDITKISVATYPFVEDHYEILDAGSAMGFGCGPILVAKGQRDKLSIDQARVAIPGVHTTAHYLFNHFFPICKDKIFKVFSEIEPSILSGEVDMGVLIHEGRFTYQDKGLSLVADLGTMWEEVYQLPVPLGILVCRRNMPDSTKYLLNQWIRSSIQYAFDYPQASAAYVLQHAQEMEAHIVDQHIHLYVNQYSLSMGQAGRQAIDFLFSKNSIPINPG